MMCIDAGPFNSLVEMEKSSVSSRSKKLFTLSAIHTACRALLDQSEIKNLDDLFLKYLSMGEAIGMSNRDISEFKNINQRLQNKLSRIISKLD
jgi:hypothetical protein